MPNLFGIHALSNPPCMLFNPSTHYLLMGAETSSV
ncbi:hypothetical protein ACVW2L_000260 [Mucilaginibacter sp. HD30]